jgi:hypothetical protein
MFESSVDDGFLKRRLLTVFVVSASNLKTGESSDTTAQYLSTGAIGVFQPPSFDFRQPAWTQKPTKRVYIVN